MDAGKPKKMAYIELHYGPYSKNGTIKHRVNRLMNLTHYYREKGHIVELIPSVNLNILEVIIGLRVAFSCRITYLSQLDYHAFGKSHDPILVKAIETIDETLVRIGQVGPNVKLPGLYKEMFNINLDFGCGVIHNNYRDTMDALKAEDDAEDDSNASFDSALLKKQTKTKSIKFVK